MIKRTAAAILFFLVACGVPLPPDKNNYVGTWRAPGIDLTITRGGSVNYEKRIGSSSTKVNAPIKEWKGDSFVAGIGPLTTEFNVTEKPHLEGLRWVMTVDGRRLTRQ